MKYMIINWVLALLPPTRWFGVKRAILRALGVRVGDNTRICGGVRLYGAGLVEIGAECWIGLNCSFYTSPGYRIVIGDRCDIAPQTTFMQGSHEIGPVSRRAGEGKAGDIIVGDGCWIGVQSILMGGSTLEEGCLAGANTMLMPRTYPASSLILGSPGRIVRTLTEAQASS